MTPSITTRRVLVLGALVAAVVLLVIVLRPSGGANDRDGAAPATPASSTPVDSTSADTTPVDDGAPAPAASEVPDPLDPSRDTPADAPARRPPAPPSRDESAPVAVEVEDAVRDDGSTPVLVDLAVPDGLTPEERAPLVAAAAEGVLASLPEGTYTAAKTTGITPVLALTVDQAGLDALRLAGPVDAVAADGVNEAFSTNSPISVEAPVAWERGVEGEGRIIAVLDTGVARDHPYLSQDGQSDVVGEACFSSANTAIGITSLCPDGATEAVGPGAAAPCPSGCDHGTHVAGIAAGGAGAASLASRSPSGIAPKADLLGVQVFHKQSSKLRAYDSDLIRAMEWVYAVRDDHPGLVAVNLSLGGDLFTGACDESYPSMKSLIDDLRAVGIATVVAAGNSFSIGGASRDAITTPACISTAVAVGWVDDTTLRPSSSGHLNAQVDILAPGTSIESSVPPAEFEFMSGTSMAAPAVAAAFALLDETRPDWTLDQRLAFLQLTGTPVDTGVADAPVKPYLQLGAATAPIVAPAPPDGAPTVFGADGRVEVSWVATDAMGGAPITAYRATASPGGAMCTTTGALSCAIGGLTNGEPYQVSVTAVNEAGPSAPSAASAVVPGPSALVPMAPARFLDTRPTGVTIDGEAAAEGILAPGETRRVMVTGRDLVPASGVAAVAVNVTVTEPTSWGYLTVHPGGSTAPLASNLNVVAGQTVPNMVIARVGENGEIALTIQKASAHVIVDVMGWYPVGPTYTPMVPARLMDTRSAEGISTVDGRYLATGSLDPVGQRQLEVVGRAGIPVDGVGAVVLNVTVADPTRAGFLKVFPLGAEEPNASNLNFVAGQTVPNLVIAEVGTDGTIVLDNEGGWSHVVVDVMGWFPEATAYAPRVPARLMDTRTGAVTIDGQAAGGGALGAGQGRNLTVTGRGGVPSEGVSAVALNVTVVQPTSWGFLRVYPRGEGLPNASNLNFVAGQTVPNMVIAQVGQDGQISIVNELGTAHVIVDVMGWFP